MLSNGSKLNDIRQLVTDNSVSDYSELYRLLYDDIETYMIRKISGSDIEGLNSIKLVNQYKNILIHRPLLKFKKNEIIKFAKKNHLEWIDDPSNYKMSFSRSKIRFILKNNNKIKNTLIKELNIYKEINNEYIEMINLVLAELII